MQFQQKMFNRYGFSFLRKRLTSTEKLDLISIISKIETRKNKNFVYKKTFNVYDNIVTKSIDNINNKRLIEIINNYTIINVAKYYSGNVDIDIDNIQMVYNHPFTVNENLNDNECHDKIKCIINLSDYKMFNTYDFFYPLRNNHKFDIKEYQRVTSQDKINPLNGCIKLKPEIESRNDWIKCPTSYGDIIFINSKIECKYEMNNGIDPLKSLHITFKKV